MANGRITFLLRGLREQCPRCGSQDIFSSCFRLRDCCPDCRLPLEQEDGWSLGAIPLNYALTCLLWVLPVGLLFIFGLFSLTAALVVAGAGTLIIPPITYRRTKALWVGIYYAVLPHEINQPRN